MPKILIVDDSEVDRRIVGGLLEKIDGVELQFAKNGREAITCLRQSTPDLVLTDLQMPERDGLELVRAIRLHYAHVPVVLMTAHGSDALAIQALEEGAVGYVAKSQLGARLVESVEEVLALARADRTYERLLGCLRHQALKFSLDNDPALLDPLVDLVQQILSGIGLCDVNRRFRVGAAFKAALVNALFRGNLELSVEQLDSARDGDLHGPELEVVDVRRRQSPYRDRRIAVDATLTPAEATFVVRDEGPGFDWQASLAHAPGESIESGSGRGLVLIRTFIDEVKFNPRGNEITLVVRRS